MDALKSLSSNINSILQGPMTFPNWVAHGPYFVELALPLELEQQRDVDQELLLSSSVEKGRDNIQNIHTVWESS